MTNFGNFQLLAWDKSSLEWITFSSFPTHQCTTYGYCDITTGAAAAAATCKCLDGFEPASGGEWSAGRFSGVCRRKEAPPRRRRGWFLGAAADEGAGQVLDARREHDVRRVRGEVRHELLVRGVRPPPTPT
ncbi:Os04g0220800 [Oryza sativa Japonica Group]|uniref:Os04g0220800 protein n=1 Tax=Oryza sativa subsp. japonica TaxID=39947 RepID=A0A0P0W7I5_ORYSJ|nr:Os04g0220800 [Oryza sativa Japonica Group]